jgi:exodeoxyribonuclease-3
MQKIKVVSWNVNGLRSNILSEPNTKYSGKVSKGVPSPFPIHEDSHFAQMVMRYDPDIVCLQETRCDSKIFDAIVDNVTNLRYRHINHSINPARGRGSGYSGTAIFSKENPIAYTNGLPTLGSTPDIEGRCCTAEFANFYVVNVYTPNSGSNEEYRINVWDKAMLHYLNQLKSTSKNVILVGDMNVCREPLDIYSGYPSGSQRIAGLLPEEIDNMKQYIENGFIDTYRFHNPDEDEGFTWWNPKIKQFRQDNKGWRIDYALVSDEKLSIDSVIASEVMGSDHCPIVATFAL